MCNFLRISLLVATIICLCKGDVLSTEKCFAYGPGVEAKQSPNLIRHFYVQSVASDGSLISDDVFNATVPFTSTARCEVRDTRGTVTRPEVSAFNRGDGTFLFRYHLSRSCAVLELNVTDDAGSHIQGSPFVLHDVQHEDCFCPVRDQEKWKEDWQCSDKDLTLIRKDMEQFPSITRGMIDMMLTNRTADYGNVIHYVVRNNTVYSEAHGRIIGFKMFCDLMFLTLTRKVALPDFELVFNLGDYPFSRPRTPFENLPVVAWCGSTDSADLVLPTYIMWKYTMSGAVEDLLKIDGNCHSVSDWENKDPRMYWRGRDSNRRRISFVREAKQINDTSYVDADFHLYSFSRELANELGKVNRTGFTDFYKYKYLLNIDGTVAAYRLAALLAGNSLVFVQESKYYEHFYRELEPYVHYVPVAEDLHDWREKLEWAREHDDEARQIAQNGRDFVRERMRPQDFYCYLYQFIVEYASRQHFVPTVRPTMEQLTQQDKPANLRSAERSLCPSCEEDPILPYIPDFSGLQDGSTIAETSPASKPTSESDTGLDSKSDHAENVGSFSPSSTTSTTTTSTVQREGDKEHVMEKEEL